jgi:hypothetical protein
MPEYLNLLMPLRDIDKDRGLKLQIVERLTVCPEGNLILCTTVHILKDPARQTPACQSAHIIDVQGLTEMHRVGRSILLEN